MRFRQFVWIGANSAQVRISVPDALNYVDRILLMRLWNSITDSWAISNVHVTKIKHMMNRFQSPDWTLSQCTLETYLHQDGRLVPIMLTLSLVDALVCARSDHLARMLALRQVPVVALLDANLEKVFLLGLDSLMVKTLMHSFEFSRRIHLASLLSD